jgi:hypothetical protein
VERRTSNPSIRLIVLRVMCPVSHTVAGRARALLPWVSDGGHVAPRLIQKGWIRLASGVTTGKPGKTGKTGNRRNFKALPTLGDRCWWVRKTQELENRSTLRRIPPPALARRPHLN